MSKYRVSEGAPGVSHNKKVYLPGELLPADLSEEAVEQLLKAKVIESEAPEKETKASEATDGPVHERTEAAKAEAEAKAKADAEAKAAEAKAKTSGQQKPPAK